MAAFAVAIAPATAWGAQRPSTKLRTHPVVAKLTTPTLARAPGGAAAKAVPRDVGAMVPNRARLNRLKARALFSQVALPWLYGDGPSIKTAYYAGISSAGISAADEGGAYTPPDPNGAVGANRYVETVNSQIAVYQRVNLAPVGTPTGLAAFVGQTEDFVFDPVIKWDQVYGHWIYISDDIDTLGDPFVNIAISKSSDPALVPATNWCHWRFQINVDDFEDYPKLGFNNSRILIGSNVFSNSASDFLTARIHSFAKPALTAASACPATLTGTYVGTTASPLQTKTALSAFTPEPAALLDSSTNGYIVAADSKYFTAGTTGSLTVWKADAAGGILRAGGITVPNYAFPLNVPQPGTVEQIDSSDTRLLLASGLKDPDAGAAPNNEAVWVSHAVAGNLNKSALQWYELLPELCSTTTDTCPAGALRQQGRINSGQGLWLFNPGIAPTKSGNAAVINYTSGNAAVRTQIRAQSRRAATGLGVMSGELILSTSPASDTDFSCDTALGSPCRWGDYAGASTDMQQDGVVWGTNQTIATSGSAFASGWATRNFALSTATSTVKVVGGVITYAAQPLANNNVTISLSGGFYTFTEVASTLANVGGCTQISVTSTKCPASGVGAINMTLLDRNDTVTYTSAGGTNLHVDMGTDNDTVNVSNSHGGDTVDCGAGTDVVTRDAGDTATNCETG